MIAATSGLSGLLLLAVGVAFERGLLQRRGPDDRLDDRVLLRFACGEFGLFDRQRDLPDRDPRPDDRHLLRDRNGARRRRGAGAMFGRLIESGSRQSVFGGLRLRRRPHVGRLRGRRAVRRPGGAKTARTGGRPLSGGVTGHL